MKKLTKFKCPICNALMVLTPGCQTDPNYGVTVWCDNEHCPTHENVFGWGKNEVKAYEIACAKYKK